MRRNSYSITAFSGLIALIPLTSQVSPLTGQDLERERKDYAAWLATAPFSPYAAIALQPIGPGITLGPADADIPLTGLSATRVTESRGSLSLDKADQRRPLPRNRAVALGTYQLIATGTAGRTQLAVYGKPRGAKPPEFYPAAPSLNFVAQLEPPEVRGTFHTLGSDGIETEATEAGFLSIRVNGTKARLRVYRMGSPDDDEAELQVFFRDSTNGRGSYPAGRFVTLDPAGTGKYRIDLNRARNPFCAYNTVFPCPPPWPGNTISAPIGAGEKYH